MSTGYLQPSACDAERERIRELAKYYCVVDPPSSTPNAVDAPLDDGHPNDKKRLSADIALTALTQLGVLRFACKRSFVSIIDGAKQHIISEATASLSLRDINKHEPDDGIYLGVRTLDLDCQVCPHLVKLFTNQDSSLAVDTGNITANSTRYVVLDFTKEDGFKDHPYVVNWPYFRFHAEVPIRSPAGYVLGSYCISDDKPRSDFCDTHVESLQEIADAIADHLETVRLSHCHRRTETLVKSLTSFVKDHADFDPTESYKQAAFQSCPEMSEPPAGGDMSSEEGAAHDVLNFSDATLDEPVDSIKLDPFSPSEATAELSSLFSKVACSDPTDSSLPSKSIERPTSASSANEVGRRDSLPRGAPSAMGKPSTYQKGSATDIANSITKIFDRASVLLRDSMDLDGVLFIDACRCNAGVVATNDTGTWEPLPSNLNPRLLVDPYPSPGDVPGVGSLSRASEKPCVLLGCALRKVPESIPESGCQFGLTEQLLNNLMTFSPQGQIFDLSDLTEDERSSACEPVPDLLRTTADPMRDICRQLASHFPDANSVLFSPLWDWNKSRWLAGTLVWTSSSYRALGAEELHYFRAFGDSIISEVARVDWVTTQKSKSDFMSSVSHELRSPLHGILASAELLGGASLAPDQQHLVQMVETCGLTLLDTLNHLLDYSGINNLTALQYSARGTLETNVTSLETVFDLGELVEEVVNVQYTGRKLPKAAAHLNQIPVSPAVEDADAPGGDLAVIVRVEDSPTWNIQSVPGAWRRIVMNVFSNSLKWTKSGFVEVSLSKVKRQKDPLHVFALLSVTDTGCGICPDFLRHKLFSPFSQENTLSEGLGLGLSIVRQLVASLDGHVNVRSELGVGTQVDILIPVEVLEVPLAVPYSLSFGDFAPLSVPVRTCLVGFNDYPGPKETPTGILPAEAKRKIAVRSCLTAVLDKFSWSVRSTESFHDVQGDVAIIEETKFNNVLGQLSPGSAEQLGHTKIIIILNSKTPTLAIAESPNVIRVSQPFGSRKFRDALIKVHDLLQQPSQQETVHPVPGPPSDPPMPAFETDNIPDHAASERSEPTATPETVIEPDIAPPCPSPKDPSSLHILLVDDNDINLKILETFARKIGCTYETASNGQVALHKYKASSRRYDLILMDISMPVMDGIASTSQIRRYEQDKDLARSRIMAVTGVASTDMQEQAKAAGIDEYLVKPVSLVALQRIVATL